MDSLEFPIISVSCSLSKTVVILSSLIAAYFLLFLFLPDFPVRTVHYGVEVVRADVLVLFSAFEEDSIQILPLTMVLIVVPFFSLRIFPSFPDLFRVPIMNGNVPFYV